MTANRTWARYKCRTIRRQLRHFGYGALITVENSFNLHALRQIRREKGQRP